jgi:putative oxidoreductase
VESDVISTHLKSSEIISTYLNSRTDAVLLLARALLMLLEVIFGWQKLVGFSETVTYMASTGVPTPAIAALASVVFELGFGIAIALGLWTRPLTLLMAIYTLAAGLIGHRYWGLHGVARQEAMIEFYKNVSIAGGSLLLCLTGPGKHSLDSRIEHRRGWDDAVPTRGRTNWLRQLHKDMSMRSRRTGNACEV